MLACRVLVMQTDKLSSVIILLNANLNVSFSYWLWRDYIFLCISIYYPCFKKKVLNFYLAFDLDCHFHLLSLISHLAGFCSFTFVLYGRTSWLQCRFPMLTIFKSLLAQLSGGCSIFFFAISSSLSLLVGKKSLFISFLLSVLNNLISYM